MCQMPDGFPDPPGIVTSGSHRSDHELPTVREHQLNGRAGHDQGTSESWCPECAWNRNAENKRSEAKDRR